MNDLSLEILEEKSELLKIMGHPVRLCIINGLYRKGSCNVSYMQACLSLPQSTISQHISKLKSAGIIKGTKRGTEISYEIVNQTVVDILNAVFNYNEGGQKHA